MASTKITITIDPGEYAILKSRLARDISDLKESLSSLEGKERHEALQEISQLSKLDQCL